MTETRLSLHDLGRKQFILPRGPARTWILCCISDVLSPCFVICHIYSKLLCSKVMHIRSCHPRHAGECPRELDPGNSSTPITVNLLRKDEDYKEPEKPK